MTHEASPEPIAPVEPGEFQGEVAPPIEPAQFDPLSETYESVVRGRAIVERRKDPEARARMERVQSLMEEVVTSRQEVGYMPKEEQLDLLEEVTIKLFDEDPEAQENIAKIKAARESGREHEVTESVAKQKSKYQSLRRQVAFDLGIELEDVQAQNEQYRIRMIELVRNAGSKDEEEIMKSLGFLVWDEKKQNYKFNFPERLFPPHLVEKWKKYETLVNEHKRASKLHDRALNNDPGQVVQLDLLRKMSHDNLANEVKEFLNLEDWDFERCRRFVEKMVNERFPNVDTRESVLTSESVINHLKVLQAAGGVIRHHHHDTDDDD